MASRPAPVGSRMRQVGWAAAFGFALAGFLALTFHVNAIRSEVRLAERQIIALQRETLMLETEFQTRASQRQLSKWNAIEFGYVAPRADQFLHSETQLAMLGTPRGLDAPDPIRVARAQPVAESEGLFADWVSPLTGQSLEDEARIAARDSSASARASLGATLSQRLAGSATLTAIAETRP